MSQPIDIGNVISLAGYLPIMAAAALFGIGLFVLSRNRKAAVNRLFAAGMLALGGLDAAWFVFMRFNHVLHHVENGTGNQRKSVPG